MHEFWCGYVKPKYGEKAKLCYMDTDSFIVHIAEEVEARVDSANFELDWSLPKEKN